MQAPFKNPAQLRSVNGAMLTVERNTMVHRDLAMTRDAKQFKTMATGKRAMVGGVDIVNGKIVRDDDKAPVESKFEQQGAALIQNTDLAAAIAKGEKAAAEREAKEKQEKQKAQTKAELAIPVLNPKEAAPAPKTAPRVRARSLNQKR